MRALGMTPNEKQRWINAIAKKHSKSWIIERQILRRDKQLITSAQIRANAKKIVERAKKRGWISERKETNERHEGIDG